MCSRKVAIVSEDFFNYKKNFHIVGPSTYKSHLPILSYVLGKRRCLKTDDLRVLGISWKSNIVTKYVGC